MKIAGAICCSWWNEYLLHNKNNSKKVTYMNKKALMLVMLSAVVIFTGCSTRDIKIMSPNETSRNIVVPEVSAFNRAGVINATNIRLLQANAEETIMSGYTNFSFIYPGIMADGSIKNVDEFIDKCANKSVLGGAALTAVGGYHITSNLTGDPCQLYWHAPTLFTSGDGASQSNIFMHNEKDKGFNASSVVEDIKKKGLYKEIVAKRSIPL